MKKSRRLSMNSGTRRQAVWTIVGGLTILLLGRFGAGSGPEPGGAAPDRQPIAGKTLMDGRKLGVILNADNDGFLIGSPGKDITPEWYRDRVEWLLITMRPGVFAQDVGMPDPVNYRSKVATTFDKYMADVVRQHMRWSKEAAEERIRTQRGALLRLFELGTDVLALSIEACRRQGVLCVAAYRMNAEDFKSRQLNLSDFARAHKEWAIPGANCLDPAIPEVYAQRMAIFREVAENYDIDGIEMDFRRWNHMVSDPHKNHGVLTRMVRDVRKVLDGAAKKKGRSRLLLGARVGPNLAEAPLSDADQSCRDLGLDVKTWVKEGLVDYLCPTTFGGSAGRRGSGEKEYLKASEFVELAKGSKTGIYPTVWCYTGPAKPGRKANKIGEWQVSEDDPESMREYLEAICRGTLDLYDLGVDGVSTFNWGYARLPWEGESRFGLGAQKIAFFLYPYLGNPKALRAHLKGAFPPRPQ